MAEHNESMQIYGHQSLPSTQRAIQPRSTARLCMTALTAGNVRNETTYRTTRIPTGMAQARGRVSGASCTSGSRRSAGLSAHDTTTNVKNTRGVTQVLTGTKSPASRCDDTAPEKWKKDPAYAHSLSRENPGAMMAAAAPVCHRPLM